MTQQQSVNQPRRGYQRSMGGMIGALIAVLGLVALIWGLSWLSHRDPGDPARTVHYAGVLAAARSDAPFHILAPEPVPAGLRATSVGWDPLGPEVSWRLGFLTPSRDFIGLYQGNAPASQSVPAETPANHPGPVVTIDGQPWRTLTNASRGETALVHTAHGVTTIVTGTADENDLTAFVRSLH